MKTSEEKRAYQREYYKKNRDKVRKYQAEYAAKNPSSNRVRKWRANNPEKEKEHEKLYYQRDLKTRSRYARNLRRYGLTLEQYDDMLKKQDGKCAICGGGPNGRGNVLHVDHDHKTGDVRGLLCGHCNHGLGKFRDDPSLLDKAKEYLLKSKN